MLKMRMGEAAGTSYQLRGHNGLCDITSLSLWARDLKGLHNGPQVVTEFCVHLQFLLVFGIINTIRYLS